MTWTDFAAWLRHMGWSQRRAAQELGLAPNTIGAYKRGQTIPRTTELACEALAKRALEES